MVVRAVHFGALILVAGGIAFRILATTPAPGHNAGKAIPVADAGPGTWPLLVASVLVTLVSGLMWLALVAAKLSGESLVAALAPGLLGTVLAATRFGHVWAIHLGLLAALGTVLAAGHKRARDGSNGPGLTWLLAVLAGVALAVVAGAGHAAGGHGMEEIVHLAADATHLVAAGLWVGGLIPLALVLGRALASPDPWWADRAAEITRRFSVLGVLSVGALVATGIANSWFMVESLPAMFSSPYGRLLMLKLGLFLLMLGLAAFNRLHLTPPLVAGPEVLRRKALRRLRRNALAEAAMGAAILVVVAALGVTAPAKHLEHQASVPAHHAHQH